MSQLVDLEMDSPGNRTPGGGTTVGGSAGGLPPESPRGGGQALRLVLVAVFLMVGAAAAWYFLRQPPAPQPVVEAPSPTPTAAPPPEVPAPTPEDEAPALELPELNTSDVVIRELVTGLSNHPQIARWLVNEDLARRLVAAVDNIAEGEIPKAHLGFMAPTGDFSTTESGGGPMVDPASYERYELATSAFLSLDPAATAQLYRGLRPLLQQAYQELGYPDGDFDATVSRAIRRLLGTPVVDGPVAVSENVLSYSFAEPRLEALPPIQKQLIRMGPENTRRIQAKLREISTELGL